MTYSIVPAVMTPSLGGPSRGSRRRAPGRTVGRRYVYLAAARIAVVGQTASSRSKNER
jgi:hypothetical protein